MVTLASSPSNVRSSSHAHLALCARLYHHRSCQLTMLGEAEEVIVDLAALVLPPPSEVHILMLLSKLSHHCCFAAVSLFDNPPLHQVNSTIKGCFGSPGSRRDSGPFPGFSGTTTVNLAPTQSNVTLSLQWQCPIPQQENQGKGKTARPLLRQINYRNRQTDFLTEKLWVLQTSK
uniref:Uncharacterized protein n=1 Tax=Oryza punctata TaxID=4537 RepID=A0A0E0JIY7_ORYPU